MAQGDVALVRDDAWYLERMTMNRRQTTFIIEALITCSITLHAHNDRRHVRSASQFGDPPVGEQRMGDTTIAFEHFTFDCSITRNLCFQHEMYLVSFNADCGGISEHAVVVAAIAVIS